MKGRHHPGHSGTKYLPTVREWLPSPRVVTCSFSDRRIRSNACILSSHKNPKICGIDDAEVVGDLVAVDMPVPRRLLAQKSQYHTSEILEPCVAFVVGAVPVHQSPQSFDRVQMWAV